MEDHRVELTTEEYERLNAVYPEGNGSGLIGKRAEEIVRIHIQRDSPGCTFQVPDTGADLKVVFCDGSEPLLIEVKGTASAGIAWQQLKVSSQHSHRMLVELGIPVYRVSDVFSPAPCIHVLRHGIDFALQEEARWTFKPWSIANQRPEVLPSPGLRKAHPATPSDEPRPTGRAIFPITGFDEGGVRGPASNLRLVCLIEGGGKLAIWGSHDVSNNIDKVINAGPQCSIDCEFQPPGDVQARKYGHTHWVHQTFSLAVLPQRDASG